MCPLHRQSTLFPYTTLFRSTSRLLKALADETRLRILHLLTQEELAGSDLMEVLNLGQSRVSTHLNLLKEVGFVGDRRDRKSTRLNSSHSQISYAVFCLKKKK